MVFQVIGKGVNVCSRVMASPSRPDDSRYQRARGRGVGNGPFCFHKYVVCSARHSRVNLPSVDNTPTISSHGSLLDSRSILPVMLGSNLCLEKTSYVLINF